MVALTESSRDSGPVASSVAGSCDSNGTGFDHFSLNSFPEV